MNFMIQSLPSVYFMSEADSFGKYQELWAESRECNRSENK